MCLAFHSAEAVSEAETASGRRPSCVRWALTSETTWAANAGSLAGHVVAAVQSPATGAAVGATCPRAGDTTTAPRTKRVATATRVENQLVLLQDKTDDLLLLVNGLGARIQRLSISCEIHSCRVARARRRPFPKGPCGNDSPWHRHPSCGTVVGEQTQLDGFDDSTDPSEISEQLLLGRGGGVERDARAALETTRAAHLSRSLGSESHARTSPSSSRPAASSAGSMSARLTGSGPSPAPVSSSRSPTLPSNLSTIRSAAWIRA